MALFSIFLSCLLIGSFQSVTSTTNYVVETRVIVDLAAMQKWMNATGQGTTLDFNMELNSTFLEVGEIFKSLQSHNLNIDIQIQDVDILRTNILSADASGMIKRGNALSSFKRWMKTNKDKNYDIALLLTGYDMYGNTRQEHSWGYASEDAVCTAGGIGVAELRGIYMDTMAIAHQIGIILGAGQDGRKDATSCGEQGYIMDFFFKRDSPNHFLFSPCSAQALQNKINRLNHAGKNCLTRGGSYSENNANRYGTFMTADEYCQRVYGASSYVARKAYSEYGDNICLQIACMTSTVGTYFNWKFALTPPGLECGTNKQCIQGYCVSTSEGSSTVWDTCPFGDQPKIEGDFQTTCNNLGNLICSDWENTCCQTCRARGYIQATRYIHRWHSSGASGSYSTGYVSSSSSTVTGNQSSGSSSTSYHSTGSVASGHHASGSSSSSSSSRYHSSGSVVRGRQDVGVPLTRYSTGSVASGHHASGSSSSRYHSSGSVASGRHASGSSSSRYHSSGSVASGRHASGSSSSSYSYGSSRTHHSSGASSHGSHSSYTLVQWRGLSGYSLTADAACRSLEASNSSLARSAYDTYGDNLCSKLSCVSQMNGVMFYWNNHKAPDGMPCGKSKRCSFGKCIPTTSGDPNMSDSCPYGDQPWLGGSYQSTCAETTKNNNCLNWERICCASCA